MSWQMHRVVISDSSCLILLSKIGRLDILKGLYQEIFIPEAVYEEVTAKKDTAESLLKTSDWIRVCKVIDRDRLEDMPPQLHLGEREAILLYTDLNADLIIIDDNNARKEATRRGLRITGIIGILARAKDAGMIPAVRPLVEQLEREHFYISQDILNALYETIGE